jgi:hypothetical protein
MSRPRMLPDGAAPSPDRERQGIRTAGELAAWSAEGLLSGDGFGEKLLVVVRQALGQLGLRPQGD